MKFYKQDYFKIKAQCKSSNRLFEDPEFLANQSVLARKHLYDNIEWKRPLEICKEPKFLVQLGRASNVIQGELGNCWFVAACNTLACQKAIWNAVIPDYKSQEFDKDYCGIFRFKFWNFGKWVEIVIDDRLPTRYGCLLFTHSSQKDEFWCALLEKAYAKMHGSYEKLDGGTLSEALQDFTGGICELISLTNIKKKIEPGDVKKKNSDELFNTMKKSIERKSLMACAIAARNSYEMEKKLTCGLVIGHAYAITKLEILVIKENLFFNFLSTTKEKLQMIRLNNPWGQSEWNGSWSDNSEEWKRVPKSERERLGLTFDDDGEFWMEFSDFIKYFSEVSICRIINTSFFSLSKTWSESVKYGNWLAPHRSGGCANNRSTFLNNPQFIFDITSNEIEETLINLDQKSLRYLGKENLTIGFTLMKIEENRIYRLHTMQSKVATSSYINTRSIFMRLNLESGRYCLVPSTFEPNVEGEFLLRIYTDNFHNLRELIEEYPKPFLGNCNPFAKYPQCTTQLTVVSAFGLENQSDRLKASLNTYICIKCEGNTVIGKTFKNNRNPKWNTSAIFYRYKPRVPIKIQVWISNTIKDALYGEITLKAEPSSRKLRYECDLFIKNNGHSQERPGTILVDVLSAVGYSVI